MEPAARGQEGHPQGLGHPPVVDLMVAGTEHGAGQVRAQEGFPTERLAGRDPLERKAETGLIVVGRPQAGRVVAGRRHHQGALVPVADSETRGRLQFPGEVRPELLAPAGDLQQALLARFGLGRRGKHTGRRPGGAPPRPAALEQLNHRARLGQAPADGKAADSRADDGDARSSWSGTSGLVVQGTAPFAGTTQIRFDGYALSRPSRTHKVRVGTPAFAGP